MSFFLPSRFDDSRCRRHGWWVLLVLTAALYLPGLGTLPLMDRDEPRFAHATVEMMERGAWVIPYFNSDPEVSDAKRIELMRKGKGAMEVGYRFDKPPLTYWWMRLHYTLFGVNEFAARLHSVIATWLVALVPFGLASRLSGARAGLAAGIAWLLTLQVIVHGRLCVADMPMVLFVALASWALLECLFESAKWEVGSRKSDELPTSDFPLPTFSFWHWILYVSLGLGFLAKGPIALLVPGLALVLMRFAFWRKPLPWRRLRAWQGLPITLALIAAWGIPALMQTEGLYWKVGMQEHVVERGTKAFNGRFPVPGYYLATAFLSLFPWIGLLPLIWRRVRETWDVKKAFLVSWLLAPYVIFTLYATQLPHYVMPGFPAAMTLMVTCGELGPLKGWRKVWAWLMPVLFFVLAIALWGLARIAVGSVSTSQFISSTTLLFSLVLLGLACVNRAGKFWPSFLIIAIAGITISIKGTASVLRDLHPATQLAAKAGPLPEKTELLGWEFIEPSLVFCFNHHWKFPSKLGAVEERMNKKGPRAVVLLRREWTLSRYLAEKFGGKTEFSAEQDHSKEVDALIAAHKDYQVVEVSGINSARASWAEVRMLVRR